MNQYYIRSAADETLYWSREEGWVDRSKATLITEEDKLGKIWAMDRSFRWERAERWNERR